MHESAKQKFRFEISTVSAYERQHANTHLYKHTHTHLHIKIENEVLEFFIITKAKNGRVERSNKRKRTEASGRTAAAKNRGGNV